MSASSYSGHVSSAAHHHHHHHHHRHHHRHHHLFALVKEGNIVHVVALLVAGCPMRESLSQTSHLYIVSKLFELQCSFLWAACLPLCSSASLPHNNQGPILEQKLVGRKERQLKVCHHVFMPQDLEFHFTSLLCRRQQRKYY